VFLFTSYSFSKSRAIAKYEKAIVRCFNKNDAAGLKALFCDELSSKYEHLNGEILAGMDLIKGKIVHYKRTSNRDSAAKAGGHVYYAYITPMLENVVTDTGDEYTINFGFYLANDKMPSTVGLLFIQIIDKDHNSLITIGSGIDANGELRRLI
jgi:hypothetical protein